MSLRISPLARKVKQQTIAEALAEIKTLSPSNDPPTERQEYFLKQRILLNF